MRDGYIIRPGERHGLAGPLDSMLSGTGRVADDLYLMAHDDRSGKPLLDRRPLGVGLAAGLLAELMLGEPPAIRLGRGTSVWIAPHVTATAIGRNVLLRQIAAEPAPLPVRDWLEFLEGADDKSSAATRVGARLEEAGYLTTVRRKVNVPGRPVRRVPGDPNWAITPISRAGAALDQRRPPSQYAAVLAGLAAACGLEFRLSQYLTGGRSPEDVTACLVPDLRTLITQTRITVSRAVLSHRTRRKPPTRSR